VGCAIFTPRHSGGHNRTVDGLTGQTDEGGRGRQLHQKFVSQLVSHQKLVLQLVFLSKSTKFAPNIITYNIMYYI
jgi:hypothetical protein